MLSVIWIQIEGAFGQGKNWYRLNYIRPNLQKTFEAWINCVFLVMYLMVLIKKLFKRMLSVVVVRQVYLARLVSALLVELVTIDHHVGQITLLGSRWLFEETLITETSVELRNRNWNNIFIINSVSGKVHFLYHVVVAGKFAWNINYMAYTNCALMPWNEKNALIRQTSWRIFLR